MKRKAAHKKRKVQLHRAPDSSSVIIVRSWIFLVLFAIMLGVGVMVGSYINNQLNGGVPSVAGYSTDR